MDGTIAAMRPAATIEAFLDSPVGRFFSGPTYFYFCALPDLFGAVLWGRPTEADVERLMRAHQAELRSEVPHVCLLDARRLEQVEPVFFETLVRYFGTERERLARVVRAQAVVRPEGLLGAVVTGFFQLHGPPHPLELFGDAASALKWLGTPEADTFAAELDALQAEALGISPVLRALRELLLAGLPNVVLADAARALGLSERSLQRQLQNAGTTYQTEHNAAQIELAKRLLRETDQKLVTVASNVGCATPQHFNALFRKLTGETPGAWRKRQT